MPRMTNNNDSDKNSNDKQPMHGRTPPQQHEGRQGQHHHDEEGNNGGKHDKNDKHDMDVTSQASSGDLNLVVSNGIDDDRFEDDDANFSMADNPKHSKKRSSSATLSSSSMNLRRSRKCTNFCWTLLVVFGVATGIIALVLTLHGTNKNEGNHRGNSNDGNASDMMTDDDAFSNSDSIETRLKSDKAEQLKYLLTSSEVLNDGDDISNAQSLALDWMAHKDIYQPLDHVEAIERFIVAVLYYTSMDPQRLSSTYQFLSHKPTCSWNNRENQNLGLYTGIHCNARGSIVSINIGDYYFGKQVPTELFRLFSLSELMLSGSQEDLYSSIPSDYYRLPTELFRLSNLRILRLEDLNLIGTLSTEFGTLTDLTQLRLFNNQLSGTIPSELGLLTELEEIRLFANRLHGSIPTQIGGLTQLQFLDLSQNDLDGSIPTEFGYLTQLKFMGLYNNNLSGMIPEEFSNLSSKLSIALAGNNGLSGSLNATCDAGIEIRNADCASNYLSCSCCLTCF